MVDDLTFQGIQHRLETSLVALNDTITPEQFTTLQVILDNLSSKLVEAVKKSEPSADEIDSMVLLAEQEFHNSMGEQKGLIRESMQGEENVNVTEFFNMKEEPFPVVDMQQPTSINDKIKAKLNKGKE